MVQNSGEYPKEFKTTGEMYDVFRRIDNNLRYIAMFADEAPTAKLHAAMVNTLTQHGVDPAEARSRVDHVWAPTRALREHVREGYRFTALLRARLSLFEGAVQDAERESKKDISTSTTIQVNG